MGCCDQPGCDIMSLVAAAMVAVVVVVAAAAAVVAAVVVDIVGLGAQVKS